jgi:hypothetical protein
MRLLFFRTQKYKSQIFTASNNSNLVSVLQVRSALATRGFAFRGFDYSMTRKCAVQYSTFNQDLHSSFVLYTCFFILSFHCFYNLFNNVV